MRKSASRIWAYTRVLFTFAAQAVSTATPGKSPVNRMPDLYSRPRAGWAPARMMDTTGTNGRIEPAPVSGVSTYSHFVSVNPATSVSRSNEDELPGAATELWPLLKSSSIAHSILLLPTSPRTNTRARSRVYPSVSRALVTSTSDQFWLTDASKSMIPLILTLGVGAWARAGGASSARMARAASGRASGLDMTSSVSGSRPPRSLRAAQRASKKRMLRTMG